MTKLAIIDTETGGLDPTEVSILTAAIAIWDDGNITDSIEVKIKEPNIVAEQRALDINRIDLKDIEANGLSPKDSVDTLNTFLLTHFPTCKLNNQDRVILVGHNVGFDVGFFKRLYKLGDGDFGSIYSYRSIDTSTLLRFFSLCGKIDLKSGGMHDALVYFGIPMKEEDMHTAIGDAIATGHLLTKLMELVK